MEKANDKNKSKEQLLEELILLRKENEQLKKNLSKDTSEKELLETVISWAPIILFSLDIKGIFTFSDGKGLEQLGLEPQQVVGMSVLDVYKDIPDIVEQVNRALKGETVKAIAQVGDMYFNTIYQPVFDNQKQLKNIVGVALDITQQYEAENNLNLLFESTLAMLCIANLDGYFTKLNPAWENVLGYKNKELLSRSFLEFVHPDDVETTIKVMEDLGHGNNVINFKNRYRCKDGNYKWLNWQSSPAGKEVYASATDITELEQYQKRLENLLFELERSNKDLEQFAYITSHDLQEPLRKIKNYGELLELKLGKELEGDSKKYLNIMINGAQRMQNLINDLLAFSRLTTRAKKPLDVDLEDMFHNVIENLELAIRNNNVQIIKHIKLPTVKADSHQLEQVFQNLISNAIKFKGDKNPEIEIDLEENNNEWTISIKDNGIGIHKKYKEHIFEVFQRLHSRNEYEGTGIGLAICKKIVNRHEGEIWVESQLGKGSTFFFTIKK